MGKENLSECVIGGLSRVAAMALLRATTFARRFFFCTGAVDQQSSFSIWPTSLLVFHLSGGLLMVLTSRIHSLYRHDVSFVPAQHLWRATIDVSETTTTSLLKKKNVGYCRRTFHHTRRRVFHISIDSSWFPLLSFSNNTFPDYNIFYLIWWLRNLPLLQVRFGRTAKHVW